MSVAQQLYEGLEVGSQGSIGLITYMRTDSTRVANEALKRGAWIHSEDLRIGLPAITGDSV